MVWIRLKKISEITNRNQLENAKSSFSTWFNQFQDVPIKVTKQDGDLYTTDHPEFPTIHKDWCMIISSQEANGLNKQNKNVKLCPVCHKQPSADFLNCRCNNSDCLLFDTIFLIDDWNNKRGKSLEKNKLEKRQ